MKIPRINIGHSSAGVIAFLVVLMMFLFGCSAQQGQVFPPLAEPLQWPAFPEKPRVRYIGQITGETDLKKAVSFGQSIKNIIFGKEPAGVLVGPYAVVRDQQDKLYIAESGVGIIHVFDLDKREYFTFSQIGNGQKLNTPVALTLVDDSIYVSDSALKKICVFSKEGKFKFSFGDSQLDRPSGIAYCQQTHQLFVTDTGKHRIAVFDKSGVLKKTIGSRGNKEGEFNFPTHIWVDKDRKLYVSDSLNYRVQIFSTDGAFIHTFGKHGDTSGDFAHPCGIATDSHGNIYVADRQFENIQIFNERGQILMAIGGEGSEPGQFWLPGGVFIDDNDRIHVADSFNGRVQIFQLLDGQSQ